jgi:outer membrane immunogenic protein
MTRFTAILLAGVATVGLSSATYAADLIIDEPIVSPGVVDVGGNWEGVYLGVFGGYGSGSVTDEDDYGFFDDEDSMGIDGWLVGVNAGANFYITDGIVGGIVGDIAWSNIEGYDDYYETQYNIDWQGSLRGKLGFDAGAFMPYLTGGLAFANASIDQYDGSYSDSQTHIGWTVGAGVEVAVTEDVSLDLLYRYSDFGSKEYDAYNGDDSFGLSTHAVTLGVNWKF